MNETPHSRLPGPKNTIGIKSLTLNDTWWYLSLLGLCRQGRALLDHGYVAQPWLQSPQARHQCLPSHTPSTRPSRSLISPVPGSRPIVAFAHSMFATSCVLNVPAPQLRNKPLEFVPHVTKSDAWSAAPRLHQSDAQRFAPSRAGKA